MFQSAISVYLFHTHEFAYSQNIKFYTRARQPPTFHWFCKGLLIRERGLNFYWLFNKLSVQTFQLGMCINLLAIVLSFRSLGFVKDYWFLTFSRNLFSSKLNKMRFNLKVKAAVSSHFVTATTVYCFSAVSTDCCISGDCNTSRDKKKRLNVTQAITAEPGFISWLFLLLYITVRLQFERFLGYFL